MAMDQRFFIPWCEFDPTGADGGIEGELAEGFVAPALGDNTQTTNVDMNLIFKICVATGSSISRHPDADAEGNPGRNLVAEIIAGTNLVLGRILDRTRSESTAFFSWTHATPPGDAFKLRPIRYPLRNVVASEAVFFFLGGISLRYSCSCILFRRSNLSFRAKVARLSNRISPFLDSLS